MKLREKWNNYVAETQSKVTDSSADMGEKTDLMDKMENKAWEKFSKLKIAKAVMPALSVFGFLIITMNVSGQGPCLPPAWHREVEAPSVLQKMLPPDARSNCLL